MVEGVKINKSFGDLRVLKDIDVTIGEGEIVSILGASGAGKTTLLQILGSLDRPDSGEILIKGNPIHKMSESALARFRNKNIGFVFQFHHLLPEFTALENCMLPALIGGVNKVDAIKKAKELLGFLSLSDRLEHKPSELSGGEKQRELSHALINKPLVIFADEPSGNLDSKNQEELMSLFISIERQISPDFCNSHHDQHLHQSDRPL